MRRLVVAVLSVVLLACNASSACAGTYTAHRGAVRATLHWRSADNGLGYAAMKLTIERRGTTLVSRKPRPRLRTCRYFGCGPLIGYGKPLTLRDLDANGEPEVVYNAYSGGAHCCFVAQVWRFHGGRYKPRSHDFGNPGYRLTQAGHGPLVEWITADDRFAYAFTSFAFSGFPIRILHFRHGHFVEVTDRFRARVRRDAHRYWRSYRKLRHQTDGTQFGAISAWAADEYRLGRRRHARRVLRREARRGHLDGYDSNGDDTSGRRFVRRLDRFLRRRGY